MTLPHIARPTVAFKSLVIYGDDDDIPHIDPALLSVKYDPPARTFGRQVDRVSTLQEVRGLARGHLMESSMYHELQAEREQKRSRHIMIKRYTEWLRETYMEDWIRAKQIKPRYRFTVQQKAELKRWFDLLDSDGSGEVSVNELEDPLLSVGLATSKQEVVDLIARVDKDGSGEIGFEEFLQVVFEAGRKSVEAAEAAKEQRAQQLLRNPHLGRGAQRTRPKVLLSNALRHHGQQRSPAAASIPGGATLSPKLLLLSMELPTLDEGLNTGALSEAKPNVSTQLALTSTMGNTLLQAYDATDGKSAKGLQADGGNPIVNLQKYHRQTGLGDFNSSICIRRRQLLMSAITELATNEERLKELQEQVKLARTRDRLLLKQLQRKQSGLLRVGRAHMNYVKNMTRLLGQQTQDAADTVILGPLSFDLRKFAIHPVSPRDLLGDARTKKLKTKDDEDASSRDVDVDEHWYERTTLKAPPIIAYRGGNESTRHILAQPSNDVAERIDYLPSLSG